MKLKVPYYSQNIEVDDPAWKRSCCGVIALKMILDFYKAEDVSVSDLIDEGVSIGAYKDGLWQHTGIAMIARNHEFNAYTQEWRSSHFEERLVQSGIKKITKYLKMGKPVLVSVEKGFEENKTSHIVVLTGLEEDESGVLGFYFHATGRNNGGGEHEFVNSEKFEQFWRKFAIFIYPHT